MKLKPGPAHLPYQDSQLTKRIPNMHGGGGAWLDRGGGGASEGPWRGGNRGVELEDLRSTAYLIWIIPLPPFESPISQIF